MCNFVCIYIRIYTIYVQSFSCSTPLHPHRADFVNMNRSQSEKTALSKYPLAISNYVTMYRFRCDSFTSMGFCLDSLDADDWILQYIYSHKICDVLFELFGNNEIKDVVNYREQIIQKLKPRVSRRGKLSYERHCARKEEKRLECIIPTKSEEFVCNVSKIFPIETSSRSQSHCETFLEPPDYPTRIREFSPFSHIVVYAPPASGKTFYQEKYIHQKIPLSDTDKHYSNNFGLIWFTNIPSFVRCGRYSIMLVPPKLEFERRCKIRGVAVRSGFYSDVLYEAYYSDVVIWTSKMAADVLPSPASLLEWRRP